jgi:hypothetical protein
MAELVVSFVLIETAMVGSNFHFANIAEKSTFLTVAMPMNSTGMNRGVIHEDGVPKTAIFNDDVLTEFYTLQ